MIISNIFYLLEYYSDSIAYAAVDAYLRDTLS